MEKHFQIVVSLLLLFSGQFLHWNERCYGWLGWAEVVEMHFDLIFISTEIEIMRHQFDFLVQEYLAGFIQFIPRKPVIQFLSTLQQAVRTRTKIYTLLSFCCCHSNKQHGVGRKRKYKEYNKIVFFFIMIYIFSYCSKFPVHWQDASC